MGKIMKFKVRQRSLTHSVFICVYWTLAVGSGNSLSILVNEGENVTLSCGPSLSLNPHSPQPPLSLSNETSEETYPISSSAISEGVHLSGEPAAVEWVLPGRANTSGSLIRDRSGALFIVHMDPDAEGEYICHKNSARYSVEVRLRRVPESVLNLTISPHSVYATVSWTVYGPEDIEGFLCMYRRDTSAFKHVDESDLVYLNSSQSLGPESRTCDVYDLIPNQTYYVKVAAYNSAGVGNFVSTVMKTTVITQVDKSPSRLMTALVSSSILFSFLVLVVTGLMLTRICRKYSDRQPVSPLEDLSPEDESLELVPHITLNPAFNIEMLEHISPDYNESSEHAFLVDRAESTPRR